MSSQPSEFWRQLKPIANVFREGAAPEVNTPEAPESDDPQGQPAGTFDVFDYIKLCKDHYENVGIGAAAIDRIVR